VLFSELVQLLSMENMQEHGGGAINTIINTDASERAL
jgi:hypothetical protein